MGAKLLEPLLFGDRIWRVWRGERDDGADSNTIYIILNFCQAFCFFVHSIQSSNTVIGQVLGKFAEKTEAQKG